MKKYFSFLLLIAISLIFLTGCVTELVVPENGIDSPASEGSSAYENSAGTTSTGKGTLKLYLTDAPGDFKELNIIVSRIEGHISVDGEGEEGYWEILKEWPGGLAVDLLTLENVSLLLGSMELTPNHYTQLRVFLLEEAELVLEGEDGPDGPTVTEILKIPSSQNSGIKLNKPFDIVEGMITKLTLDFDAQKSVIKTGNGKYKMKPVISVQSESYSSETLPGGIGSVSGNVSYYDYNSGTPIFEGIDGANIELAGGAYIFANTTTTDSEGGFSLMNVPVGTYDLNVDAGIYGEYLESIEVTAEADTAVDVVFLAEVPGSISGSVVIDGTITAIEGAIVMATLSGGSSYVFVSSVETDSSGNFLIEQLPVGIYDLTISAINYQVYSDLTPGGGITVATGVDTQVGEIGLESIVLIP